MSDYRNTAAVSGAAADPDARRSYASSVNSETPSTSYLIPKAPAMTADDRLSKTQALKSWVRELASDIGKPPTYRYDQQVAAAQSSSVSSHQPCDTALGAPYLDNRPTKI